VLEVRIWFLLNVFPPSSILNVVLRDERLLVEEPEANRNCDRLLGFGPPLTSPLGRLTSDEEEAVRFDSGDCSRSLFGGPIAGVGYGSGDDNSGDQGTTH
jgi:hypothetical protein